jgi:hypothetical protein
MPHSEQLPGLSEVMLLCIGHTYFPEVVSVLFLAASSLQHFFLSSLLHAVESFFSQDALSSDEHLLQQFSSFAQCPLQSSFLQQEDFSHFSPSLQWFLQAVNPRMVAVITINNTATDFIFFILFYF